MKIDRSKGLLIGLIFTAAACVFQIVGLIRYLGRMSGDWVGIVLYCASIIAFAVVALGFYIQWRRR